MRDVIVEEGLAHEAKIETFRWSQILPVGLVFAVLAGLPFFGQEFYVDTALKMMIYGIFALSVELMVGRTGLVVFGHAGFFGLGAYVVVLMGQQFDSMGFGLSLLMALTCSGLYALVTGALSLRTKGVYFIMITLAFSQLLYFLFHDASFSGGSDGAYLYYRPQLGWGETPWLDIEQGHAYYFVVLFSLITTFCFLGYLVRSRFGHALAGIRMSEQRMRAVGFDTFYYKLSAFVLSAMIAALAGYLFALKDGFVNPELLSWHQSGAVLVMVILGGKGHLRGALMGAAGLLFLEDLFQSEAMMGDWSRHWQLSLGLTIVLVVAFLPKGLMGIADLLQRQR